jgi:hypothetical protein
MESRVVDQEASTAQHHSVSWWTRWRLRRSSSSADAQIALWKSAWLRGANAAWEGGSKANPYDSEMQRAAWQAGAKWATENPNRRTNRAPRFAHPRRRASDAKLPAVVKRTVAVTAASVTLYAISKTVWKARRTAEDKA